MCRSRRELSNEIYLQNLASKIWLIRRTLVARGFLGLFSFLGETERTCLLACPDTTENEPFLFFNLNGRYRLSLRSGSSAASSSDSARKSDSRQALLPFRWQLLLCNVTAKQFATLARSGVAVNLATITLGCATGSSLGAFGPEPRGISLCYGVTGEIGRAHV